MHHVAGSIPIIVFTERGEHELALLVIDEGAADNVTRGQFSTDPYKLRDTIEFALARDKISKNTEHKSASDYKDLKEQGMANLRHMAEDGITILKSVRAEAAATLEDALHHGREDLKEAIAYGTKNLKDAQTTAASALKENVEKHKEKDQIIAWMSGGYSMDKNSDAG